MSLSLLRFTNEIRALNPLAKVDVEGSNPFSRSKKQRSKAFSVPSRQAAYFGLFSLDGGRSVQVGLGARV